ncbi:MAG: hypothetical protein ACE5OZ_22620 [Candidatus Heimdallarchaeota archaeon]
MPSFLKKKKLKEENLRLVFGQLSQADGLTPLEAYVDNPVKEIPEFRHMIKQWIDEDNLDGYITTEGKAFVPKTGLLSAFKEAAERGKIDVARIVKRLKLPVKQVKGALKPYLTTTGIEGFWDCKERTFFTESGAKQAILDLAKGVNLRIISEVAGELNWTTDQVLITLESLAENNLFRGFLDADGIIQETTTLKVDLLGGGERAEKLLAAFCKEKISHIGYAPLFEVGGVFGLNEEELDSILENAPFRAATGSTLRISRKSDAIYEPISQLELFFKVLLSHHQFPLDYIEERAGLPKEACQDLFEVMRHSFPCIFIDGDIIRVQSIATLLRNGVNLNPLMEELLIPKAQVIRILAKILRLSKNYLWVAGDLLSVASSFSFSCHLDNGEKDFPTEKVVMCLNCKYQECYECFSTNTQSMVCSRCGARRAFLLEFPRECPSCLVALNNVENLHERRFCPICKDELSMPLESPDEEGLVVNQDEIFEPLQAGLSLEDLSALLKCSKENTFSILETDILKAFPSKHFIDIVSSKEQIDPVGYWIRLINNL